MWFLLLFCQKLHFFLFKINYFLYVRSYEFTKHLIQYLPLYISCLLFKLLNEGIVDIEKPDRICSLTFVVDEFSWWVLHSSIFYFIHQSIIYWRPALKVNGALSDLWYWLNCNISVSSKGMIVLQKSLFSRTFLRESSLFFVLKEWRQFRQKESP